MNEIIEQVDGTNFFGTVYFAFHHELYRRRDYAQAHFTLYVSCRANIDKWEFNHSDIRFNTGIHHQIVSANCEAFVVAGIFRASGTTSSGSPKYKLNKSKFDAYIKGGKPLVIKDNRARNNNGAANTIDTASNCSNMSQCDMSQSDIPACRSQTSPTSECDTLACRSVTPNNKERKKREKEDVRTKSECAYVFSNSPDAKAKAGEFIKLVNQLQARESDLLITISGSALTKATDFFNQQTNFYAETLADEFANAAQLAAQVNMFAPANDAFDHWFYLRRASSLDFFFKNRSNVIAQMEAHNTSSN